jgi:ferredoxin-NADP reductase
LSNEPILSLWKKRNGKLLLGENRLMFASTNHVIEHIPAAAAARRITVQVVRREVLLPGVVQLSLALPGTIRAPTPYTPGQFITLSLPIGGQLLHRSYSLCGNENLDKPWVITVKRQDQGVVSGYLTEQLREGMQLQASLPQGAFVLPVCLVPGLPLIFVAAGSGITPILGMLSALARLSPERRPAVHLHYASRSPAETIFLRELEALDPTSRWLRRWFYFSVQGTHLTPQQVLARAGQHSKEAHWYICGPAALKRDLQHQLEAHAVPAQQVHTETFASPASTMPPMPGMANLAGARLRVAETGAVLPVQPQETLLDALERHGYEPESSCRAGACGTCKLRLLSGRVHLVGDALSPAERQAGYVLGCVARPVGDVTIDSGGQPPVRRLAPGAVRRLPLPRQTTIRWVRALTALAAFGLVIGSWSLIGRQPSVASSAPAASPSPAPGASSADPASNGSSAGMSSGSSSSSPVSATPSPVATTPSPLPTTQSGTS